MPSISIGNTAVYGVVQAIMARTMVLAGKNIFVRAN
jgi:hypothetical protein